MARMSTDTTAEILETEYCDVPLAEYHLRLKGKEWRLLHSDLPLTLADEHHFFDELRFTRPFGIALWAASIALAHELAERASELGGKSLLELGAGTGLPGIV